MSKASTLSLGVPSKGRLMDQAADMFARCGLTLAKTGAARGYQGKIEELGGVEVAYLSASEIARNLAEGKIDLGITGEDLLRETIVEFDARVEIVKRLGFGRADVVVAVPETWLDVWVMADLDDIGPRFNDRHGRGLRIATKYVNLARRFFTEQGVTGYRIAESLGATEGAPAAGSAEVIVDITSTGSTLRANHLRVLKDGVILESEAVLAAARTAPWPKAKQDRRAALAARLNGA